MGARSQSPSIVSQFCALRLIMHVSLLNLRTNILCSRHPLHPESSSVRSLLSVISPNFKEIESRSRTSKCAEQQLCDFTHKTHETQHARNVEMSRNGHQANIKMPLYPCHKTCSYDCDGAKRGPSPVQKQRNYVLLKPQIKSSSRLASVSLF